MAVASQQQVLATPFVTKDPLLFTVDFASGVTIPSWVKFCTQAQITQYLVAKGASSFKYLQEVWNSLPERIDHSVSIAMAQGVHRPRLGEPRGMAWDLSYRERGPNGSITIGGSSPIGWTTIGGGTQTISAYQAASQNPYVDVGGTPYTGLDLKGYFAVLSTGQTCVIHDNTASRLYLMEDISPTPVGGTVRVAKPNTILRNSLDDLTPAYDVGFHFGFGTYEFPNAELSRFTVEPFGNSTFSFVVAKGMLYVTYLLIDNQGVLDSFGVAPNGNTMVVTGYSQSPGGYIYGEHVSIRGRSSGVGSYDDLVIQATGLSYIYIGWLFARGSEDGVYAYAGGEVGLYEAVLDGVGKIVGSPASVQVNDRGVFGMSSGYFGGKRNEIRGGSTATGAVIIQSGGTISDLDFIAKNLTGSIIQFLDGGRWSLSYGYIPSQYVQSGGGNTQYGLEFKGLQSIAHLLPATTFGAALGDVKMADGTVLSLASIVSGGGVAIDGYLNIVRKDS